jgi:hypothetical protein
MKSRTLKQLMENIGLIDNLAKGLNINKKAVALHSSTVNIVREKMNGYTKKHQDQEYMKTLSPAEQQVFMQNVRNMYETHKKLTDELDYLDMTKHPTFLLYATQALDKAYLLIEYMYKNLTGECGDLILPHLTCIKVKDAEKATYTQMIYSLTTELEAIVHDFYEDNIHAEFDPELLPYMSIYSSMVEAYMWLSKENERLKTEALPETKTIDVPIENVPPIPKGPSSEPKN